MNYLLDTSAIIDLLKKKNITHFISSHEDDVFFTSCICKAEIVTGIYRDVSKSKEQKREEIEEIFSTFFEIVPFDSISAEVAGEIKADLLTRGDMIDDLDILIAASAIAQNATIITSNVKHFQRVKNLRVRSI